MKQLINILFCVVLTIAGISAASCSDNDSKGGIHGVAVDAENQEPMRGVNVQLCKQSGTILGSTITYDDGHFEFTDVTPGDYTVIISSTKYPNVKYDFSVKAGRTASLDIPLGLYTNPYFPIYLSSQYTGWFRIKLTMPNEDSVEIIEKGVYYSESDNPMTTGAKAEHDSYYQYSFNGERTTMYYVQAYVKDDKGNTYLSEIIHITEQAKAPEVKTVNITRVNATKVILEGLIEHKGNPVYTERGFIISTEYSNPTISDIDDRATKKQIVDGSELTFNYQWTDFIVGTKYYIKAYATNELGTAYGRTIEFDGLDWYTIGNLMVQKEDLSDGSTWTAAGQICKDSRIGGFSNWRLPTKEEMEIIISQKWLAHSDSSSHYYWTSTMKNGTVGDYYHYYGIIFQDGSGFIADNNSSISNRYGVRAVCTIEE